MDRVGLPIRVTLRTILLRVHCPAPRADQTVQAETRVLQEVRMMFLEIPVLPEVEVPILRVVARSPTDHPVVATVEVALVEDRRVLPRPATAQVDRAVRHLDHPRQVLLMQVEAQRKIDRSAAHQLPSGQAKACPNFSSK